MLGPSSIFKIRNAAMALTLVMAFAVVPGAASAAYVFDGIITAGEYVNDFSTEWYNDHETLKFPEGGGQTTTVWWEDTGVNGEFRLGLEAPLAVKNMIWGDWVGSAAGESEALLYYQAWCSPTDGNPAALNGSNCGHHSDGFNAANASGNTDKTFVEKILKEKNGFKFKTMVDSEKVIIMGDDFKLKDTQGGAHSTHDALVKSSLTYIFAHNGGDPMNLFPECDEISCDAASTSMSFEMLFVGDTDRTIGIAYKDWLLDAANDLVFHMSPERGGPLSPIPVPAAFWLFGTALIGFVSFSKRRNIST